MYIIKRKICNKVYCQNWITLKTNIETEKKAYKDAEKLAKNNGSHLKHIIGIFEEENVRPIRTIEVKNV